MSSLRGAIAFGFSLLLGCAPGGSGGSSGASTSVPKNLLDAWVRFPHGVDLPPDTKLSPRSVFSVLDAGQREAQELLAARAWLVLDPEMTRRLVVAPDEVARSPGVPVLLRSVRSERDASGLEREDRESVRWKDGVVVVTFEGARSELTDQVRRAFVAILPAEPTEIYVECLTVIVGGVSPR